MMLSTCPFPLHVYFPSLFFMMMLFLFPFLLPFHPTMPTLLLPPMLFPLFYFIILFQLPSYHTCALPPPHEIVLPSFVPPDIHALLFFLFLYLSLLLIMYSQPLKYIHESISSRNSHFSRCRGPSCASILSTEMRGARVPLSQQSRLALSLLSRLATLNPLWTKKSSHATRVALGAFNVTGRVCLVQNVIKLAWSVLTKGRFGGSRALLFAGRCRVGHFRAKNPIRIRNPL